MTAGTGGFLLITCLGRGTAMASRWLRAATLGARRNAVLMSVPSHPQLAKTECLRTVLINVPSAPEAYAPIGEGSESSKFPQMTPLHFFFRPFGPALTTQISFPGTNSTFCGSKEFTSTGEPPSFLTPSFRTPPSQVQSNHPRSS